MIKGMGFRRVRYGGSAAHGLRFLLRGDGQRGRK